MGKAALGDLLYVFTRDPDGKYLTASGKQVLLLAHGGQATSPSQFRPKPPVTVRFFCKDGMALALHLGHLLKGTKGCGLNDFRTVGKLDILPFEYVVCGSTSDIPNYSLSKAIGRHRDSSVHVSKSGYARTLRAEGDEACFKNRDWFNYDFIDDCVTKGLCDDVVVVRNKNASYNMGGTVTLADVVRLLHFYQYPYTDILSFHCRWDGQSNKAWNFTTQTETTFEI